MARFDIWATYAEPLKFLDIGWMREQFERLRGLLEAYEPCFGKVAQQGCEVCCVNVAAAARRHAKWWKSQSFYKTIGKPRFDRDVIITFEIKKYQCISALSKKYIMADFEIRQCLLNPIGIFNKRFFLGGQQDLQVVICIGPF